MISVDDARTLVLDRARPHGPRRQPTVQSHRCVLAADILATLDSPPHDKALMDGYAVRAADVVKPGVELKVLEQLTAGQLPTLAVGAGTATRIMTGAPVPEGADAVVMVERTEVVDGGDGETAVRIQDSVSPGQNVMRRAESMRRGDIVLRAGQRIRAIEMGLLAELGIQQVDVFAPPKVAVLATGNELVPHDIEPKPGQIRNSNGPMLVSLVNEADGEATDLGIASDTEEDLAQQIRRGLEYDVLLLSGGVSAGVLDLVPKVMGQVGVQEIFHKVRLKPGKPLWFGVARRGQMPDTLVFGLPGNPVSSLVCFLLFVRPAMTRISGRRIDPIQWLTGTLTSDWNPRSDRPVFHPARAREEDGAIIVGPVQWRGSSDLRSLADANALLYFPGGVGSLHANDEVKVYLL